MQQYELTVLIHPDLEMNLAPATDKVEKLIKDNGGKIVKETNEGKKKLAYEVKGQEFAIFYYYELELPADAPRKISTALNITDETLRYLLVKTDERKAKLEAKQKARRPVEAEEGEDNEENNEEE